MDKAANIAYRTEAVYLSQNSTFANARTYSIQSATELYGADSPEVIATTNAWYAVGVGAAYSGGGGGTPPADDCYTQDVVLTLKFDNYPEETSWTLKDSSGATVDSQSYTSTQGDGSTVTKTFTGLAAGSYTFTISDAYGDGICCSYGSGNYSLKSGSVTFKTGSNFGSSESTTFCIEASAADTQAPSTPANLAYSNVATTSATLSWSASTDNVGVTGYQVFRGTTNIGSVTGTSANITGLTANTAYSFHVKATDAAGNVSGASNTVSFTTLADSSNPSCVSNSLALTIVTDRYPRETSWSLKNSAGTTVASKSAGSYTSSNRTYTQNITGLAAGDYTFTINDTYGDGMCCSYGNGSYTLKSGTTTVASGGNFGSTQSTSFCVNAGSGVAPSFAQDGAVDPAISNWIRISPNPAKDFTSINLEDAKPGATYEVFDQAGNLVLKGELSSRSIDIQSLSTGMYVVKVYHGNEVHTEKLIKK